MLESERCLGLRASQCVVFVRGGELHPYAPLFTSLSDKQGAIVDSSL